MSKYLNNTFSLTKFIFKKERLKLILYIVFMSFYLVAMVPIFGKIISEATNSLILVDTMRNPAMVFMLGPVFVEGEYTVGSMYANYVTVFIGIMFATWNILFVSKQTRYEEEMGMTELVESFPVGRYSNIASTLIVSFISNLILCLLMILGFNILSADMSLSSIINFSVSTVGFGFLFSVIALIFAQISSSSRLTNTLSFLTLFAFYILRAIGDVTFEVLSFISPLGLIYRTESFINDYSWPILILFIEIIILFVLAIVLAKNRDLNSGLIKESDGKKNLSPFVRGVNSFNLKLQKSQIIIWGLVILVISSMYGSILGDLEGYIESSDLIKQMLIINKDFSLTDQFIGLLILIMSIITAVPALLFLNRIVSEENKGYSQEILTKSVSRYKYFASFIILSLLMTIIYQLLMAVTSWWVGRYFLEDIPKFEVFLISSLNYIPGIVFILAIGVVMIGWKPRFYWLSYLYLGYSFFIVYIGRILNTPKFLENLSPFGLLPNYPLENVDMSKIIILLVLSLIFILLGMKSYRKRDIG